MSFLDVFDVVVGHKPLSCSTCLKLSWVFDVFVKSLVQLLVVFNSLDMTTRLDRSALHFSILGGGVVKHIARFTTPASSRSPATTIRQTPPPDPPCR